MIKSKNSLNKYISLASTKYAFLGKWPQRKGPVTNPFPHAHSYNTEYDDF